MITFGNLIPTFQSEPLPFPSYEQPIIAPFWAGASYLSSHGGDVRFGVTTSSTQLNRARSEITQAYTNAGVALESAINPTTLVIVTWNDLRRSNPNDNAVSVRIKEIRKTPQQMKAHTSARGIKLAYTVMASAYPNLF